MKDKFIKSTLVLLIGGLLTKILGMIIKIIMSRKLGTEGLSLYMLILPTFSLFIGIGQFGLPIALSKLIAEDTKNNKLLIVSIIPIIVIINIILIIFIILFAPFLANNLLHNNKVYLAILAIALVIPMTSISSICRSYFFGKGEMFPHILSNIVEDIVRLLIIYFFTDYFLRKGLKYAISFIVLSNIISELASILILIFFLPKKVTFKNTDLYPNKKYLKESLTIAIPNTISRLIGSFAYFLEPIIITTFLAKNGYSKNYIIREYGYSKNYIIREYGIISGYVLPLLLLPSFFTLAISQALLPIISKEYANKNYKKVKRKIKEALIFSLLISIPVTIFLEINPSLFLNLIYNTNEGIPYIRFLAPLFVLQYIEYPLTNTLEAIGKSKVNMHITIIGTFLRTLSLLLFTNLHIGLWSLIYTISLSIIITSILTIKNIKKYLST